MCKENTISTTWSWISAIFSIFILATGIIVSTFVEPLTWGEITIIPFIWSFFLNSKQHYCFTDSGFTFKWIIRKNMVPVERIKQVDVFSTKSGTWIVIELNDAPPIPPKITCATLLFYAIKNRKDSFLLPLQWGERDKALEILRICCPQKIIILS